MKLSGLTYFEDETIFKLNCDFLSGLHEGGVFVETLREIYGDRYVFSKTTRKEAKRRFKEEQAAYEKFVEGGSWDENYYKTYRSFQNEFRFMLILMDALGKDFLTKEDFEQALANSSEMYKKCLAVIAKQSSQEEPAQL